MENRPYSLDENYSVISSGVKIKGNIESSDSLSIAGTIEGDVTCAKEIELEKNCKVIGDIQSESIVINGADIAGNIIVRNQFDLDKDSIIVGSLSAQSAKINGKIEGPVSVSGEVYIASTAVLIGDVVSSTIVVENGAQLKGNYSVYNEVRDYDQEVEEIATVEEVNHYQNPQSHTPEPTNIIENMEEEPVVSE